MSKVSRPNASAQRTVDATVDSDAHVDRWSWRR